MVSFELNIAPTGAHFRRRVPGDTVFSCQEPQIASILSTVGDDVQRRPIGQHTSARNLVFAEARGQAVPEGLGEPSNVPYFLDELAARMNRPSSPRQRPPRSRAHAPVPANFFSQWSSRR